jgi:hypothetical protein
MFFSNLVILYPRPRMYCTLRLCRRNGSKIWVHDEEHGYGCIETRLCSRATRCGTVRIPRKAPFGATRRDACKVVSSVANHLQQRSVRSTRFSCRDPESKTLVPEYTICAYERGFALKSYCTICQRTQIFSQRPSCIGGRECHRALG